MIAHLTPCFIWWPLLDLNQRPSDYEFLSKQPKINSLRLKSACCVVMNYHRLSAFFICTAISSPL